MADFPTLRRVGKVYPLKGSKNLSKTIVDGKPTVFSTGYLKEWDIAIHIPPGWSVNKGIRKNFSVSICKAIRDGWLPSNITAKKFFGCTSFGVLVAVVPEKIKQAESRLAADGGEWVDHVSSSCNRIIPVKERDIVKKVGYDDVMNAIHVLEHNLHQLKTLVQK